VNTVNFKFKLYCISGQGG